MSASPITGIETAAQRFRPWSTISPYEMSCVSGAPIRAADTAKPLMNVSPKPAFSMSCAESASKQHGMTCSPGFSRSARRRAGGVGFAEAVMVR